MSLISTRTTASYWSWQNPSNSNSPFGELVTSQGKASITDSQRFDPNNFRLNEFQIQTSLSGDGNFFVMVGMTVGYSGSISNPVYGRNLYIKLYKKLPTGWVSVVPPVMKFSGFHMVRSVSLNFDGSVMAIGFTYDDGASTTGSNISYTTTGKNGIVNIFKMVNNAWNTGTIIVPSGSPSTTFEQLFGQVVVLSNDGKRLALSNPGQSRTFLNQGCVYIYNSNDSITWGLGQQLISSSSAIYDAFGAIMTMSADGSTIAARGYQSNLLIFINGSLRNTLGSNITSVSLNGNGTVLSIATSINFSNPSSVSVLKLVNSVWVNDFTLAIPSSMSMVKLNFDGNLLIIGNPRDTKTIQYQGSFSIYSYTNSVWTNQGKYFINPGIQRPYDLNLGYNVDISDDGHTLSVVSLSEIYPNYIPTKMATLYYSAIVP